MVEVIWSPQSLQDVDSISAFISKDSEQYASVFVLDLLEAINRISDFPEHGRVVPELGIHTLREIILGNYRVIYRIKGRFVEIVTVHHGARLLDQSRLK